MHDIAGKSRESGKDSAEEKKGNPSVYVPYTQQLKRGKKARVHYFFFQLLPRERGAADASTTQGASPLLRPRPAWKHLPKFPPRPPLEISPEMGRGRKVINRGARKVEEEEKVEGLSSSRDTKQVRQWGKWWSYVARIKRTRSQHLGSDPDQQFAFAAAEKI